MEGGQHFLSLSILLGLISHSSGLKVPVASWTTPVSPLAARRDICWMVEQKANSVVAAMETNGAAKPPPEATVQGGHVIILDQVAERERQLLNEKMKEGSENKDEAPIELSFEKVDALGQWRPAYNEAQALRKKAVEERRKAEEATTAAEQTYLAAVQRVADAEMADRMAAEEAMAVALAQAKAKAEAARARAFTEKDFMLKKWAPIESQAAEAQAAAEAEKTAAEAALKEAQLAAEHAKSLAKRAAAESANASAEEKERLSKALEKAEQEAREVKKMAE